MKVTLTYSEAVDMLKKAYYPSYLSINENVELEIEPNVTATVAVTEDNPWIDVPDTWNQPYCPALDPDTYIEFIRNNGERSSDWARYLTTSWIQEDCPLDIVQYRKAT